MPKITELHLHLLKLFCENYWLLFFRTRCRVFWTFKPKVIKIDPYNSSYTVSKLMHFFETQSNTV